MTCVEEFKGLCTSVASCDLNALCWCSEVPLMYGTEAYIAAEAYILTVSSDPLKSDPVFGIVSERGFPYRTFQIVLQFQW